MQRIKSARSFMRANLVSILLFIAFIVGFMTVSFIIMQIVRQNNVYTRFAACSIAQRSYYGRAALIGKEIDRCWDIAEKQGGIKVLRYYGEAL